jgi:hypothetical protein
MLAGQRFRRGPHVEDPDLVIVQNDDVPIRDGALGRLHLLRRSRPDHRQPHQGRDHCIPEH